MGFPSDSDGKESGNPGSISGWGRSLEEGMATHSSILAWRIPWTEEPGRLQSLGLQRVRQDRVNTTPPQHTHTTWLGGMARLCPGGGRGLALKAPCARAGGCGGGVGRWWLGVGPVVVGGWT